MCRPVNATQPSQTTEKNLLINGSERRGSGVGVRVLSLSLGLTTSARAAVCSQGWSDVDCDSVDRLVREEGVATLVSHCLVVSMSEETNTLIDGARPCTSNVH